MKRLLPTNTDPAGADRPLLRQKDTESKSRASLDTGTSKKVAALNTRAPSMCVLTPRFRHSSVHASRKARGITYNL